MRSAPYASTRLASPATAFCSSAPAASRRQHPSARRETTRIRQNRARRPERATDDPRLLPACARKRVGPSTNWRSPLPRTPPNGHAFEATPCCGTSFASIPSRVPSQNTRHPRASRFAATASPGKMWPPVPPVVIMTVPVMAMALTVCPHACGLIAQFGRCAAPEGELFAPWTPGGAHTANLATNADFGSGRPRSRLHARSARNEPSPKPQVGCAFIP